MARGGKKGEDIVKKMIGIYCNDHHGTSSEKLCSECADLYAYAKERLKKCPFGKEKPFCAHCPHPCYRSGEKERMQKVMRYAGPRMMKYHPRATLSHMWETFSQKHKK